MWLFCLQTSKRSQANDFFNGIDHLSELNRNSQVAWANTQLPLEVAHVTNSASLLLYPWKMSLRNPIAVDKEHLSDTSIYRDQYTFLHFFSMYNSSLNKKQKSKNTNHFHDYNNTLPILKISPKRLDLYLTHLLGNKTWNVSQYISGSDQSVRYAHKKDLVVPITCL